MDINILVGPVYGRQRPRLTDISDPDVNHTLCMPMGIHIGMIIYTQACLASTCYEIGQQAEPQLERLLIEASVTPSLLCPIDGY
jgi:hypothetical protein